MAIPDLQVRDVGSSWIGQQQIFPNFFPFLDPSSMEKLFCYFAD